jgi:hypothetical protein
MSYTNALIILFVVISALGFYATCRVSIRAVLREYRFFRTEGTFEIMEHLLPLALLAVYWPFGAGYPSGPAALTCVRPAEPSDRHMIGNIRELDHDEAGTSCCDPRRRFRVHLRTDDGLQLRGDLSPDPADLAAGSSGMVEPHFAGADLYDHLHQYSHATKT